MIETKTDDAYQLGTWVGRKQAFAALAGRCSAADAECLRRVRNSKMYRALKMSWREFCKQRLGMSGSTADLTIHRLEEFGPQYFILAHATGITPQQYRRIRGSVRGQTLLHAGEEISIQAENAPWLADCRREIVTMCQTACGAGGAAAVGEQREDRSLTVAVTTRTAP